MEVQLINEELLAELHRKACSSDRLRMNFDLRTTPEDGSQRMLNALEVGTKVPIHRHEETSETVICIQGKLDMIFYEEFSRLASSNERPEVERPNMDAGGPGREFQETNRVTLCPKDGCYGVQIPKGAWHTIEVKEVSTIFESKDGKYMP